MRIFYFYVHIDLCKAALSNTIKSGRHKNTSKLHALHKPGYRQPIRTLNVQFQSLFWCVCLHADQLMYICRLAQ